MKAIETTATVTENGQLILDIPLKLPHLSRVRIIILIDEDEDPKPNVFPDQGA
jgi:hypothetical protein